MEKVVPILEQSLQPATAKQAENVLKAMETEEGFPITLLHIVANGEIANSTRLAGALYFKNLIKRKWINENGQYLISINDVEMIKKEIISLMIILPDSLQLQIGESISLIAESEFPQLWSTLIDELVEKLSMDDLIINKGVLKVAHSIFKRWRPLFRSDELFLEIKMVLDKFSIPFMSMLQNIDKLIDENLNNIDNLKILFENLNLLVKIYYDLNCQDIPEFFEDNMNTGINILLKYLKFHNKLLEDDDEDDETNLVIQVKINIVELIQLYTTRYEEEFHKFIEPSIEIIWNLLNNITIQPKNDLLVSKLLQFMTSIVNLSSYNNLFINNEDNIKQIIEKIILPNITIRESDLELFEDDPIEYTRRDLEGSDINNRRRSATEFLKSLKELNENLITNMVMNYINQYLSLYNNDKINNWKFKDISIYLFCSIASNGSITNSNGITSTNLLVDIIKFFNEFIYPDLINNESINPILKVDSIKYLYIFRNQLTKNQLLETLPLLTNNFNNLNYTVNTFTSITIEKILSLRNPNKNDEMLFNKNDLSTEIINNLLIELFKLIFKMGLTPEKLSENEFLMKCIMRILIISEDLLDNNSILQILNELIKIIEIISKNPSNPKFSHYTFECICIILKNNNQNIIQFYEILKNSLFNILGQDIQEFIPYSFQILSYILEKYPQNVEIPIEYEQLIKPLCSPQVWEFKGNIPAIQRLLSSIIKFKPNLFNNDENITPILGIYQKLLSSKVNDHLGFEILETILIFIDIQYLNKYLNEIFIILLTRLKNFKTDKFIKRFIIFLSKMSSLESIGSSNSDGIDYNKNKWNSDMIIKIFENIQIGLFEQILNNFIIININKINNLTDKKLLVVGLTNMIVNNNSYNSISPNNFKINDLEILKILSEILKLLNSESILNYKNINENDEILKEIENEEISLFNSNFNKLTIIQIKSFDPLNKIINNKNMLIEFFKLNLTKINNNYLNELINQLDPQCKEIINSMI